MKGKDKAQGKGTVKIQLFDKNGNLKDEEVVHNLLVDTGLAWMAGRFDDDVDIPVPMSHMAIGAGTTAAASVDTTLETELGRVALDSITNNGADAVFTATFPAGTGTGAVTEAGIFNAALAGTMLNRTVFAVKNKAAADAMVIQWTVTQT